MKTILVLLTVFAICALFTHVAMTKECSKEFKIKANDKADIKSIKWFIS